MPLSLQLDLSGNQLCGLDEYGRGTYSSDGITAIAEVLCGNGALTECTLRSNNLGIEGWMAIFSALRDGPDSKISKWDLFNEELGPAIAKPLAEYIAVAGALTSVDLSCNELGPEGAKALVDGGAFKGELTAIDVPNNNIDQPSALALLEAMKGKNMQSIGMAECNLGVDGAKKLVEYMPGMGALTRVDVSSNYLSDEAKQQLRVSVQDREGFKLLL